MNDNREITDYTLVEGYREDLQRKVRDLLQEGWQPFGSLKTTLVSEFTGVCFYQPMVKYEA